MTDASTIASLATAGGTLVLAIDGGVDLWRAAAARHWNLDREDPR
ncbi:MAG TPA: hypothetical protein VH025_07645 [Solirubrobacteraceae bacterium]|nr:hypothetical protein [Solirubrobacteraceae bacterium]